LTILGLKREYPRSTNTRPGSLLGDVAGFDLETSIKPVSLAGRVPVKVNSEGGPIQKGDRITLSSVAGVGTKATTTGLTVGIALENFSGSSGKILVFVDLGYSRLSPKIVNGELIEGVFSDVDSIYSRYSSTVLPAIVIAENGNIGIGLAATATPAYELEVAGDIAAQSFINISTRAKKKDITYLGAADYEDALLKIKGSNVATYRYIDEDASNPLRLGLIAEEAPLEVLSVDGEGVDLYKLSTLTFAGVKALAERMDNLELRVANLEAGGVSSSGGGGVSIQAVVDYLASVGATITNGIATFINLVAETLTVGSPEKPTGITLYDEVTGEPYCLSIADGVTKTRPGECTTATTNNQQPTTTGDTEPPVITIIGNNPAEVEVGATYSDNGVTVTDNVNDNLGYSIAVDGIDLPAGELQVDIDTSALGEHTITYTATDAAGNTTTAARTVVVYDPNASSVTADPVVTETASTTEEIAITTEEIIPDTTLPVITLLGEAIVEIEVGGEYVDAGATALDDVDGDITSQIVIVNSVDIATAGIYTVTYNVSDSVGNKAEEVVRTVHVVEPILVILKDTATSTATSTSE